MYMKKFILLSMVVAGNSGVHAHSGDSLAANFTYTVNYTPPTTNLVSGSCGSYVASDYTSIARVNNSGARAYFSFLQGYDSAVGLSFQSSNPTPNTLINSGASSNAAASTYASNTVWDQTASWSRTAPHNKVKIAFLEEPDGSTSLDANDFLKSPDVSNASPSWSGRSIKISYHFSQRTYANQTGSYFYDSTAYCD